jgi:hypothetical protein
MGKGGSAPPPPDYRAAAKETAIGDLEAARSASAANRVNQITPYGSLTYKQDPTKSLDPKAYQSALDAWRAGGQQGAEPDPSQYMAYNADAGWTATQSLSPAEQKLLDYQNKTSEGLGELTGQGLNYVKGMMADPFTTKNLASIGIDAGQTYQDAYMKRLQPQINQSREALSVDLANRGIPVGSEAWNRAQINQATKENDLMLGATTTGFGTGLSARQQGFNELAYQRNEPLNTLNAVRSGAQVTNPNFVSVPQQATTKGADMLGAATAEGNYNTASANAAQAGQSGMTSGLMSLAGTAAMAF